MCVRKELCQQLARLASRVCRGNDRRDNVACDIHTSCTYNTTEQLKQFFTRFPSLGTWARALAFFHRRCQYWHWRTLRVPGLYNNNFDFFVHIMIIARPRFCACNGNAALRARMRLRNLCWPLKRVNEKKMQLNKSRMGFLFPLELVFVGALRSAVSMVNVLNAGRGWYCAVQNGLFYMHIVLRCLFFWLFR